MYKEQLIREALSLSTNAIEYYVSQILADRFPNKALVEGGDGFFNVEEYAPVALIASTPSTFPNQRNAWPTSPCGMPP